MIVGDIQINKGEPGKVKTWSIIVLIISVIGLITGTGFFIGTLLGLIGGILGLIWKPPVTPSAQATTT
jgi:flagellar basal body-associated protein FliL